jgi:hypothetical protein
LPLHIVQRVTPQPVSPNTWIKDHRHPVVDTLHVGIGGGGDDSRLQVIANKFPDPSKSKGLPVTALEVKGLPVTLTPFIESTGRNEASALSE